MPQPARVHDHSAEPDHILDTPTSAPVQDSLVATGNQTLARSLGAPPPPTTFRLRALPGSAVIARRATAAQVDQQMLDAADASQKGMTNNARNTFAGKSTVADKNEAAALIGRIESQDSMLKDYETDYGASESGPRVANVQAKFTLQKYQDAVESAGGAISQFAAGFEIAAGDFGRIQGAATAVWRDMGMKGDALPQEAVEAKFKGMAEKSDKTHVPELRKELDAVRGTTSGTADFGSFQASRHKLTQTEQTITTHSRVIEGKVSDYAAACYEASAATASATAKKKQGELDAVRKEIDNFAKNVGKVGKVAKFAMGNMMAAAPAKGAPVAGKAADDAKDFEVGKDWDKLKGESEKLSKELGAPDLTDPEAVAKIIGEFANEEKINGLQSSINKAKEESNLAAAEAALIKARKPLAELTKSLAEFKTMYKNYKDARTALKQQADNFVAKATAANKPGVAQAVRLLAECDTFASQSELTIAAGDDEQKKAADVKAQKASIQGDGKQGATKWVSATRVKAPLLNVHKHVYTFNWSFVELTASGGKSVHDFGGSFDGSAGPAANSSTATVAEKLAELKRWRERILKLRADIESALGEKGGAGG